MAQPSKYSDSDAADIIEAEGVGYAVQEYVSASYFSNPETIRLWAAAGDALNALVSHVRAETGRDLDA